MAERRRHARAKQGWLRARSAAFAVAGTLLVAVFETRCARLLDIDTLGVAADSATGNDVDAAARVDAHVLPYMLGYVFGSDVAAEATVESWLGRPLDVAGNSIDTNTYFEPAPYLTRAGAPMLLEINFPILSIFGETPALGDMQAAAFGDYDGDYRDMATTLASLPNPLLAVRIGAQFNSGRYPWGNGVGTNATYNNYVMAFRRIASLVRQYNPDALIEWCVTWGGADPTPYWPGKFDSVSNTGGVDVVSMVLYQDQVDGGAWATAREGGTINVDWMVAFAQEQGVRIALSEYAAGTVDSGGVGSGPGRNDGKWTADSIAWMNQQDAGFFLWELWSSYPEADDLVTPGANPAEQAAWTAAWSGTSFAGTWWDGAAPPSAP